MVDVELVDEVELREALVEVSGEVVDIELVAEVDLVVELGWKLMSYRSSQDLCQRLIWLHIGCIRAKNILVARSFYRKKFLNFTRTQMFPSLVVKLVHGCAVVVVP